jgi:hypothetical protein
MTTLYLTRRNLRALLAKLDRTKAGDPSACTIIKCDTVHPKYPCSDVVQVTAIEDEDYYGLPGDEDRQPGRMHPTDEAKLGFR